MKSLKKNYIFTAFYQLVAILVPIITTPYLARILGSSGLGQYGYVQGIYNYFFIFAVLGFNLYGQREIARHRDKQDKSKVFWEIMIAKSIPSLLAILIYISFFVFNVLESKYIPIFLCFLPALTTTLFDVTFLLKGDEEFKFITIRDLIVKVVGTLAIFLFVKKSSDVWIYALCYGAITFFSVLTLLTYAKRHIKHVPFKELRPLPHLLKALPFFIPTISASVFASIDKTCIQFITGSDSEVGYYEEAQKIIVMLFGIISCLGVVISPRNSKLISENKYDEVKDILYKSNQSALMLGMPMMFGLIVISKIFVPVFFGEGFDKTATIMQILSPMIIIMAFSNLLGLELILPQGRSKIYSLSIVLSAAINVGLNFLFINLFDSIGASIASLISELFTASFLLICSKKYFSLKKALYNSRKYFLASLIMGILLIPNIIFCEASIPLLIATFIEGVVIYFSLLYIMNDSFFINIVSTTFKFKRSR